MSGSSALGTLLATRLDAVLGTTLAQHPVLLQGSRGHQVAQPAQALHGQDTTIRPATTDTRELALRRGGEAESRHIGQRGAQLPETAGARAGAGAEGSARTVLSEPARTILALLLSSMQQRSVVQGRTPLLPPPGTSQTGNTGGPPSATGGNAPGSGPAAGQSGGQTAPGTAVTSAQAATPGAQGASLSAGMATGSAGTGAAAGTLNANLAGAGANASATAPTAGAQARPASVPLPSLPTGFVSALSTVLQRSVSLSGMFYESHLAQMAFGQRDPNQLRQEPQARLPQPPASGSGSSAAGQTGATVGGAAGSGALPTSVAPTGAASASSAAASTQTGAPAAAAATAGAAAGALSALALPGIHPDAAALVRQQLETLAQQSFAWQGELWRDAPLSWEIQRRDPDELNPATHWATRLHLQLPHLGEVEARLSLADQRLVLRLVAPASAGLMHDHLAALREQLLRQGLQLSDTAIVQHTEAA